MWRKTITTGAAAAAVWLAGTSFAEAHGWHGFLFWPHARPLWGQAEKVEAVSEMGVPDGCPHESPDGLSLFIASGRGGEPNDIWVADRASVDAPWQAPRRLPPPINLEQIGDFCPTPVRGRSLMFVSARAIEGVTCQGGGGDMFISRQSPAGGWSEPVHLGCAPDGPNTGGTEFSPSLVETPYGTFLFYSTNGTTGHQDIHVSVMRKDGTFGPGTVIDALSSPSEDVMPNVREREHGGYEIVFSSNRPGGAGENTQDVYMAFAWFLPGPWSRPVNVGDGVNKGGNEQRATLSQDGKRLYFGRDGDIYVSERNASKPKGRKD